MPLAIEEVSMHRSAMLSLVMGVTIPVLVVAQTPPPGSGAAPAGKPLIVTGCLRSTPNPDPAGAAGKMPIYTIEAVPDPPAPPQPTGTSKPGSPTTALKPTVYTLSAAESIGLAKHVDHRVELTGKLQSPAAPKAEATETKSGGAHNTLEVTALKMVSTSCNQPPELW
jgi:hypothetical protein